MFTFGTEWEPIRSVRASIVHLQRNWLEPIKEVDVAVQRTLMRKDIDRWKRENENPLLRCESLCRICRSKCAFKMINSCVSEWNSTLNYCLWIAGFILIHSNATIFANFSITAFQNLHCKKQPKPQVCWDVCADI